ncbi:leucine-rich repeat transmembrane neuronal protein 4 [Trichoplusia ni]|uniref:Leucine-rich repeat transmembrane neuronal protein 4 n=1 Tax=Trichoplusia ni TaxID=7111 RepID=A0A7E5WE17_TRINI|nr:leucine-rich repeat transmembrane neuronal protein 4 [Trichoplusia ni]
MEFLYLFMLVLCGMCVRGEVCPKQCDCDMDNGLNRAMCVDQNIINIDVGVSKAVQVYSLSHNAISELDNFCFKESGYTSLEVLDLSFNTIFWIGLHAFSDLDKLKHLDLSSNRLRFIPSDLFWDTPQLETLDLSSNVFESIKNEPLIMHASLKILNLNNCRIKALPNRLFNRLPNLRKLDLSENYVVTLNTEVLLPLRKLERIELRNDYWQCNTAFTALEDWITSRGITYQKQCTKRGPNMSEKMIAVAPPIEKVQVDLNEVWNITTEKNETATEMPPRPLTPFEKFDKEFSSLQAFIIGMEIGLAFGIVGTYIWLNKFCTCGALRCDRPQNRRQRRRRMQRLEGDMRTNLLWSTIVNPDLETPPLYRRELSLPDRSPPFPTYGLPIVTEAPLQVDAIRLPDRSETPPPPYNDCRINI